MQKAIIILFLSLLMGGCHFFTAPGKDDCEKLLSQEQMSAVLTDVYLMENYLMDLQGRQPDIRDSAAIYYSQVFEKHGITYEVFDEALSCYLLHRQDMMAIHESILSELSIRMGEVNTTMPVMAPAEDSDTLPEQEPAAPEADTLVPADPLEEEAPPEEPITR